MLIASFVMFTSDMFWQALRLSTRLDGFVCAFDGLAHRVLDGIGGSAGVFDEFINGIFNR